MLSRWSSLALLAAAMACLLSSSGVHCGTLGIFPSGSMNTGPFSVPGLTRRGGGVEAAAGGPADSELILPEVDSFKQEPQYYDVGGKKKRLQVR